MFKKIILTLSLSLFTTTVVADSEYYYLKGGVGFNNIKTAKFSNHDFEGNIRLADSFPLIESGIGFRFANGIRIEGVFDYYFLFRTNETSTNPDKDIFKISARTKADSIMLNAYKDIVTINKLTPFVGGGIGLSKLQESASGYVVSQEDSIHYVLTSIPKHKKYHFTYKLTLGVDVKLNKNTTAEISYNYFNFGSNKQRLIGGLRNIGNRSYEIHSLMLGLRMAI